MPAKKNSKERLSARQEAFAVHLSLGKSASDAYRLAGYEATGGALHVNASKLARQTKVKTKVHSLAARADEMRARAMESAMIVTAQSVSAMLSEAFDDAKRWKQTGAQVAAAMGLAKLHGLLVDRTEDVTRRATRDPNAPIEIDVEHWVTEQTALLSPSAAPEPSEQEPFEPPFEPRAAPYGDALPEPYGSAHDSETDISK